MNKSNNTFDWEQYLHVAYMLKAPSYNGAQWAYQISQEARYRIAISKAYYALFHFARKYAIVKLNYQVVKQDAHRDLIECFEKYERPMAQKLRRIRNYRADCDYQNVLSPSRLEDYLNDSLKTAQNEIKNIKKALSVQETASID